MIFVVASISTDYNTLVDVDETVQLYPSHNNHGLSSCSNSTSDLPLCCHRCLRYRLLAYDQSPHAEDKAVHASETNFWS